MGARIQKKKVNNKGKALFRQQHVASIKEKKRKGRMKKMVANGVSMPANATRVSTLEGDPFFQVLKKYIYSFAETTEMRLKTAPIDRQLDVQQRK